MAVYLLEQPEILRRLMAYCRHRNHVEAAREAGCSESTMRRTWREYSDRIPEYLSAAHEALQHQTRQ